MDSFIFNVIKRLGVFTIIAQTMIHFCPNTQYEKYIKVLIGIMSITIVITPFLGLIKNFSQNDFAVAIGYWEGKILKNGQEGMDFSKNPLDSIESLEELNMVNGKSEIVENQLENEIKSRINNLTNEEEYMVESVNIIEENQEINKILIGLIERTEGLVRIDDINITKEKVTEKEYERWKEICATCLGINEAYLEVEFL